MLIVGGEFRTFAVTGFFAIPFMILVVLAYRSESEPRWIRFLTFAYWILLTIGMSILAMLLTIVQKPERLYDPAFKTELVTMVVRYLKR